jgi:hypothetical protein
MFTAVRPYLPAAGATERRRLNAIGCASGRSRDSMAPGRARIGGAMRQYLLQFVVVFLGVAGALVAYDYWRGMRLKGSSDAVLATAESKAADIAEKTEAALETSRERQDAWAIERRTRALFAGELARVAPLKTMLTECYFTNGVWPDDPTACGIEPADFRGELLELVRVEPGGVFVAHFRAGHGLEAGTVRFAPEASGAMPRWTCTSPSYRNIAEIVPECRYAPSPARVSPAPGGT